MGTRSRKQDNGRVAKSCLQSMSILCHRSAITVRQVMRETFLHYAGIETRRASFNGVVQRSLGSPTMFDLRVLSKGKENDSSRSFCLFRVRRSTTPCRNGHQKRQLSPRWRDIVQRHFPEGEMRNCSISSRTRLTELRRERNRQGI